MRRKIAIYFDDDSTEMNLIPEQTRSLLQICEAQAPWLVDNVDIRWEEPAYAEMTSRDIVTISIARHPHPDNPPDAFPFKDADLRAGWLECLLYLEEREASEMTYSGWLEAERDIGLDTLSEEGPEFLSTYLEYQDRVRKELWYVKQRNAR